MAATCVDATFFVTSVERVVSFGVVDAMRWSVVAAEDAVRVWSRLRN